MVSGLSQREPSAVPTRQAPTLWTVDLRANTLRSAGLAALAGALADGHAGLQSVGLERHTEAGSAPLARWPDGLRLAAGLRGNALRAAALPAAQVGQRQAPQPVVSLNLPLTNLRAAACVGRGAGAVAGAGARHAAAAAGAALTAPLSVVGPRGRDAGGCVERSPDAGVGGRGGCASAALP
jgi:hypothetical protein